MSKPSFRYICISSQIYRTPVYALRLVRPYTASHTMSLCMSKPSFRYICISSPKDSLIKRRGRGGAQYAPHSGEGRTGALRRVRGSSCAQDRRSQVPLHSVEPVSQATVSCLASVHVSRFLSQSVFTPASR